MIFMQHPVHREGADWVSRGEITRSNLLAGLLINRLIKSLGFCFCEIIRPNGDGSSSNFCINYY